MNGIEFILRDRAGWMPPIPLPRRRLRWVGARAEAIKPEEIEFIRSVRGRLSTYELAECYCVSPQTISNIWAGRCSAGLSPRPARTRAKRKQK